MLLSIGLLGLKLFKTILGVFLLKRSPEAFLIKGLDHLERDRLSSGPLKRTHERVLKNER